MNENAQKWVEALRSGDFDQTRNALRRLDGYCCLGVACNLYADAHPSAHWLDPAQDSFDVPFVAVEDHEAYRSQLPPEVAAWLGLTDELGAFGSTTDTGSESLANLNDTGESFEVIAATIEAEPPGLFK